MTGPPPPLSGAPASAEPKRERATISAPAVPEREHPRAPSYTCTSPLPRAHSLPQEEGSPLRRCYLLPAREDGLGAKGKGVVKCDTLRRRSPPSRCRTCRPSRRSLLRMGGSEPKGLISRGIAEGESELDTPSHAAAATSKPAFAGLFMPAERGKEPEAEPVGRWGQSMRGTF